jgi:hypothetical protein
MVGRATAALAIVFAAVTALAGAARSERAKSTDNKKEAERAKSTDKQKKEAAIDPRADALLRRMTTYTGGLKSLRVEATTVDEKVTTAGQKIQEIKESKIEMQRPNQIAIDRMGPHGRVLFRYDGKRYVIYGVNQNVYGAAPAPSSLEAAIDDARDRFGIDAPAGDLIAADAYQSLLDGVTEGRYLGLEPVGGELAHHLAMRKDKIDYELWIKDGPEPIPLRYVITSRDVEGQPQFTLELHQFTPNPTLSESSFNFVPPPGAQEVALGNRKRM